MRALAIKLILFCGVVEGLQYVDLPVLVAGTGMALAGIVCMDYLARAKAE